MSRTQELAVAIVTTAGREHYLESALDSVADERVHVVKGWRIAAGLLIERFPEAPVSLYSPRKLGDE